jgi:SAM-dependent methyltransferase
MTLTSAPHANSYLGAENLGNMALMGEYNQWIYETIAPAVGSSVLEAGCGNGNITQFLIRKPGLRRYLGLDLSHTFCRELSAHYPAQPNLETRFEAMDLAQSTLDVLQAEPFESVVCLNVLEHIEDDLGQLRRFHEMLVPRGRLALQVPAFQTLFGTIDEVDQHFRRYNKRTLVQRLRVAGFEVEDAFYFNFAGIPAWIWHGKIRRLRTHSPSELKAWDRFVPFLKRVESFMRPPIGLSLFAIARRP